jgi:hypothetical protein
MLLFYFFQDGFYFVFSIIKNTKDNIVAHML